MLVRVRSSVQGLNVFIIEVNSSSCILNDLLPLTKSIIACGAVRVVDWIGFAKDGLSIEINSLVVVLGRISSVPRSLQLPSIVVTCFSGKAFNCCLIDLGKLVCGLDGWGF